MQLVNGPDIKIKIIKLIFWNNKISSVPQITSPLTAPRVCVLAGGLVNVFDSLQQTLLWT